MAKQTVKTKVELVRWLRSKLAAKKRLKAEMVAFDIMDLVKGAHFSINRSTHSAYHLVIDEMINEDWDWSIEDGPDVHYDVKVAGIPFELEAPYNEILFGEATWKPKAQLEPGVGAKRFKNIDTTISGLVDRLVDLDLPSVENLYLPCEGVPFDILYNALYDLVAKGAELYLYGGERIKVKFPEDDERDFEDFVLIDDTNDAANIAAGVLYGSMEYEIDWSECFPDE